MQTALCTLACCCLCPGKGSQVVFSLGGLVCEEDKQPSLALTSQAQLGSQTPDLRLAKV